METKEIQNLVNKTVEDVVAKRFKELKESLPNVEELKESILSKEKVVELINETVTNEDFGKKVDTAIEDQFEKLSKQFIEDNKAKWTELESKASNELKNITKESDSSLTEDEQKDLDSVL